MRVTVIGTCRVHKPFRLLADDGRVELRNAGVYGYVHSAKQVVQQLEVMHGRRRIPSSLAPYITHKHPPQGAGEWVDADENDLADTDLLVVELSTLKEIEHDGYFLQVNRLRQALVGDSAELRRWWKELYRDRREVAPAPYLEHVSSEADRRIVESIRVSVQDETSLHEDMGLIRESFAGPVWFVPHFATPTFSGQRIPLRDALARYVEAGARALGCPFLDPGPLVEAFGLEHAALDMAHYTPAFERVLAEYFAAHIVATRIAEPSAR